MAASSGVYNTQRNLVRLRQHGVFVGYFSAIRLTAGRHLSIERQRCRRYTCKSCRPNTPRISIRVDNTPTTKAKAQQGEVITIGDDDMMFARSHLALMPPPPYSLVQWSPRLFCCVWGGDLRGVVVQLDSLVGRILTFWMEDIGWVDGEL